MDKAKEKQNILDYVAGLQDSAAVQDLKNFIESRKKTPIISANKSFT